ncbi:HEPN domain-containing protein [Ectothiorhodospiraceae bacterium BW-2]|nr:HEPN domain-containing protein [Ectothiorhodospiraceae bacterium BW-2]
MNRKDLQLLSNIRLTEAEKLLSANCYHGAYYLAGYAIECALKSCIAKQVQQYDFPDKNLTNNSYTHDLEKLINTAGLKQQLSEQEKSDETLYSNWLTAKDWSETSRYECELSQSMAEDMISAINDPESGVLQWLKNYW